MKVGTVIATMAGEGGEAAPSMPAAAGTAPADRRPLRLRSLARQRLLPPWRPIPRSRQARMVKLTVREALRDAMAEEMRATTRVS
ncbi:MAG: hypothetical protein LKM31_10285 [Sphingobium sp.]|nr:hypothetical protein [Sphingobium sp.]